MAALDSLANTALPFAYAAGQDTRLLLFGAERDPDVLALVHREPGSETDAAVVRIHSACLTGDVLGSLRCDCGAQLQMALEAIGKAPFGVLLYFLKHEGRGIGLLNKLRAYELQDRGMDTVDANLALGLPTDGRDFAAAPDILSRLGARRVRLMTNNPHKVAAFEGSSLVLDEVVPLQAPPTRFNAHYLDVKHKRLGHLGSRS